MTNTIQWVLDSDEPWTRYRTLVDLLDRPEDDPDVQAARADMLAHPLVQALVKEVGDWPGYALKRHNDAKHTIHKLAVLADFGLTSRDPGLARAIDAVLARVSSDGALQTLVNIPRAFGGTDEDEWTWMICDTPTLLYALLALGMGDHPSVQRAVEHLTGLVEENGWRCRAAAELGAKFRGPGRKADPCPIANVLALKAIGEVPELLDSPAARAGVEMLLWHWEHQRERKLYLFGIGTDFRKLKYPLVWYDVLHVLEVLSRYPFARIDPRLEEILGTVAEQADKDGRYTASSMYRAWKDWSFADKKTPSPWLTYLAMRIQRRVSS